MQEKEAQLILPHSQAPNMSLTEFLECLIPVPATVKNVGMFTRVYSCLTVSTCSLHSYSFKTAGRLSRILQVFKEQVSPLWIWLLISRILEKEEKNSLPSCGSLWGECQTELNNSFFSLHFFSKACPVWSCLSNNGSSCKRTVAVMNNCHYAWEYQ